MRQGLGEELLDFLEFDQVECVIMGDNARARMCLCVRACGGGVDIARLLNVSSN